MVLVEVLLVGIRGIEGFQKQCEERVGMWVSHNACREKKGDRRMATGDAEGEAGWSEIRTTGGWFNGMGQLGLSGEKETSDERA